MGHPERFTELHGEEKREDGVSGIKRGESKLASNHFLMCASLWTAQRLSRSYTEKRRGRKETEVARRIKEGNEKERDRSSP